MKLAFVKTYESKLDMENKHGKANHESWSGTKQSKSSKTNRTKQNKPKQKTNTDHGKAKQNRANRAKETGIEGSRGTHPRGTQHPGNICAQVTNPFAREK